MPRKLAIDVDIDLPGRSYLPAEAMENYLSDWQARVEELDSLLGPFGDLILLGRGTSLAAVWTGSLINKEAAKCAFEGLNAADFRYGPLELVSPHLTVLIFAGAPRSTGLNRDLARDVIQHCGKVIWFASQPDPTLPSINLPAVDEIGRPLVEILPLQIVSVVMAQRNGFEPGVFRYVSKVTLRE